MEFLTAGEKISLKLTGRKRPLKVKLKISRAHKGKKMSDDAKKKNSEAKKILRKWWNSLE